MSPHDERRFKTFIGDFVRTCGISPPFHVVVIATNGSVSVQRVDTHEVELVCSHVVPPGFVAPLTVTVIGPDGVGKSARIAIETAARVLQ